MRGAPRRRAEPTCRRPTRSGARRLSCGKIVAQDDGTVMLDIMSTIQQRHRATAAGIENGRPCIGVRRQLPFVPSAKFFPTLRTMAEPLPQRRAWCNSSSTHPPQAPPSSCLAATGALPVFVRPSPRTRGSYVRLMRIMTSPPSESSRPCFGTQLLEHVRRIPPAAKYAASIGASGARLACRVQVEAASAPASSCAAGYTSVAPDNNRTPRVGVASSILLGPMMCATEIPSASR